MASGTSAVLTTFLTNLIVAIVVYIIFSCLRVSPWAKRFFAARRYATDLPTKPKRLPWTLLGWLWPTITYKEADHIDSAGLDAAMYVRILTFGVVQSLVLSVWCIIAILPVNLTGDEIARLLAQDSTTNGTSDGSNNFKFTNFDRFSLSNIPAKSPKMWVHLVCTWFVGLFTLWMLYKYNRESILLRLMFIGNSKRGGPSHTVLVTDIPGVSAYVAKHLAAERKASRAASGRSAGGRSQRSEGIEITGVVLEEKESSDSDADAEKQQAKMQAGPVAEGTEDDKAEPLLPDAEATQVQPESREPSAEPAQKEAEAGAPPAAPAAAPPAPLEKQDSKRAAEGAPQEGAAAAASCEKKKKSKPGFLSALRRRVSHKDAEPAKPAYRAGEKPRVGKSDEELLAEVEQGGGDDDDTSDGCHEVKRYDYDMRDCSLDAEVQAKLLLDAGLSPEEMVQSEMALVYSPDLVAAVNMVPYTAFLEPLATEYAALQQGLEDWLDQAELRLKLRQKLDPAAKGSKMGVFYGPWGAEYLGTKMCKKVDVLDFTLARMHFLKGRIIEEQKTAMARAAPSAFVTFNTRMSQTVGASSLHHHDVNAWRVQSAPAPFEVVWKNLAMRSAERSGRYYVLWAVFWFMTLFFMIPVAAIQALIEVPKLATIPVLGDIVTAPGVRQIIEGIIPGLVLKIFLAIVPIILKFMALYSGATSIYEVDFGVTKRFFLFQVIVVFFGNIIAGSFFNQITQWAKDPGSVIPILGNSIPMTSTFFINYMFTGLGVKAINFLRIVELVLFWVLSRFAGSPRARQRLWMYQYIENGKTVAEHTIAILLGMVFSCINPIMCLACLAYFMFTWLGERYNNIYVLRREYESGGRLWGTVFNQVMVGLYLQQLCMLALLLIKKFPYALLLLPLPFICVIFHVSTLNLYSKPWELTALHDAADLDMWEADKRRRDLVLAAKKERRERLKRVATDAEIAAALTPGPSELTLKQALSGKPYIVTPEEQAAIAEMYRNPAFKLELHRLDELDERTKDVRERLVVLNQWLGALKAEGKGKPPPGGAPAADAEAGTTRDVDPADVFEVPPEVTKFDNKPPIDVDSEQEEPKPKK